jgi:hypothetical protein
VSISAHAEEQALVLPRALDKSGLQLPSAVGPRRRRA